jgi:hypothetical protein
MDKQKSRVIFGWLLIAVVLLACGLFPASEATPTPIPPTDTPDITPTPEGSIINSRGGYTLYIPNGYYSNCIDGTCLIGKNNPNFGSMIFQFVTIPDSEIQEINDLALILLIGRYLEGFSMYKEFNVEHSDDPVSISIGSMDGKAMNFTGVYTDADGQNNPMEGQIAGLSPGAEQFFWALAWVNTNSNLDIWKNQEKDAFHFILNTVIFESAPTLSMPTGVPTSAQATSTPEPSVVINLGPGKFGQPLWLEVVKGDYRLTSGATLRTGSAIDAHEDWLTFPRGLVIHVKDGEITLKGKTYPAGTTLYVDSQGNLTER